jgi:hypothetical protein
MTGRFLLLRSTDPVVVSPGPHLASVHWEFWLQLSMSFRNATGRLLSSPVSAVEARELADLIDSWHHDRGWRIHLGIWDDHDGGRVALLVRFLRGGGFEVVERSEGTN